MNCKYLIYEGNRRQNDGYRCTHSKIYEGAELYQNQKKKHITKSVDFVGRKEPRKCLRWCPLKSEKIEFKTVTIPACENHEGIKSIDVTLKWICPICKSPRGKIEKVFSYDGSLRMLCDGWQNPCGHIDKYSDVRKEGLRAVKNI